MKRLIALILTLFLSLSLIACASEPSSPPPTDTTPPTSSPLQEPEPEDTGNQTNEPSSSDNSTTENDNRLQGGHNERLPLEIIETGYGFATWNESSLSYGIVLYNPNSEALEFPSFRITARRENNSIIGTDEKVLNIIYPNQTLTIGDIAFRVIPDEVHTVEFEVLEPSDWNWTTGTFVEFEAINLHLSETGRDGYNVTGEISNPNDRAFDRLRIDLIIRDSGGQIVGGDLTFVDGPSANGTVPFQIGVRDSILQNIDGTWEVEIHASPW